MHQLERSRLTRNHGWCTLKCRDDARRDAVAEREIGGAVEQRIDGRRYENTGFNRRLLVEPGKCGARYSRRKLRRAINHFANDRRGGINTLVDIHRGRLMTCLPGRRALALTIR